jgi:hypothetical protein
MITFTPQHPTDGDMPNSQFSNEQVRQQLFHESQIKRSRLLLAQALRDIKFWNIRLSESQVSLAKLLAIRIAPPAHLR